MISAIRNLPDNVIQGGQCLLFEDTTLWRLNGDKKISVSPMGHFVAGSVPSRWATATWHSGVFFTNRYNKLAFCNGTNVGVNANLPAGEYLDIFFDHFVISRPTYKGQRWTHRTMWSSLRDYCKWDPEIKNTADFYDFISVDEHTNDYAGITGQRILGDSLYIYLPRSIQKIDYVGGKLVMQKKEIFSEYGCVFPYSVTGYNQAHAFIGDENIYLFDGFNPPKEIGDNIWDFFINDISTVSAERFALWSFLRRDHHELWWVYISKTSEGGAYDRAIFWNYKENKWGVADIANWTAVNEVADIGYSEVIDDVETIIDDDERIIDFTGSPVNYAKRHIYGTKTNTVFADLGPSADLDQFNSNREPYLETKDYVFNDLENVKENDTIVIHADYDEDACDGIQVEMCCRDNLHDPIVWEVVPELWKKDIVEKRLTMPRCSFRALRLRFTFKFKEEATVIRFAKLLAWGLNVYLGQEEDEGAEK